MGGFFPGMLGDLLKMLRTDAPFPYELSLQLAQSVTTGAGGESNVDPLDRIRIEQLTRLAELQVADVTGMTTTPSGRPMAVVADDAPRVGQPQSRTVEGAPREHRVGPRAEGRTCRSCVGRH